MLKHKIQDDRSSSFTFTTWTAPWPIAVRSAVDRESWAADAPQGYEAQVDFGTGIPVMTLEGRRRKTHVFRIVLSCSRKGHSVRPIRSRLFAAMMRSPECFWE